MEHAELAETRESAARSARPALTEAPASAPAPHTERPAAKAPSATSTDRERERNREEAARSDAIALLRQSSLQAFQSAPAEGAEAAALSSTPLRIRTPIPAPSAPLGDSATLTTAHHLDSEAPFDSDVPHHSDAPRRVGAGTGVGVAALYPYFRREEARFGVECNDLFKMVKSNNGAVIETFTMSFLKRHLPRHLEVFNGIIFDIHGTKTHEVDAVVVDGRAPMFPIDTAGDFHLVPVEPVMAAIEIKASASENHLRKAITQLSNVKALELIPDEGTGFYHPLFDRQPPLCAVLLASGSLAWEQVEATLLEADVSRAVDFVGIIGQGCIVRAGYPSGLVSAHGGEYIVQVGEGACSAVLSYLISRRPLRRSPLPRQYYTGKYFKRALEDEPGYQAAWHIFSTLSSNSDALNTALTLLSQVPEELQSLSAFVELKGKIERKLCPPTPTLGLSTGGIFDGDVNPNLTHSADALTPLSSPRTDAAAATQEFCSPPPAASQGGEGASL